MAALTDQQRAAISEQIFRGQKIAAIKLHREATGAGLREAKEAVEAMEQELRQSDPGKFAKPAGKSGCMSVLAVVALLVSAMLVTVYILRS